MRQRGGQEGAREEEEEEECKVFPSGEASAKYREVWWSRPSPSTKLCRFIKYRSITAVHRRDQYYQFKVHLLARPAAFDRIVWSSSAVQTFRRFRTSRPCLLKIKAFVQRKVFKVFVCYKALTDSLHPARNRRSHWGTSVSPLWVVSQGAEKDLWRPDCKRILRT